jgi:hypothetical protein
LIVAQYRAAMGCPAQPAPQQNQCEIIGQFRWLSAVNNQLPNECGKHSLHLNHTLLQLPEPGNIQKRSESEVERCAAPSVLSFIPFAYPNRQRLSNDCHIQHKPDMGAPARMFPTWYGAGFQPLIHCFDSFLGRCPRLI